MELLTPSVGLIFWQVVIFVALVLLLTKIAWKPILKAMKEREDFIQQSLDSAERTNKQMEALKADNAKLLEEAREERAKILREAREAASRMHDEAGVEARKHTARLLEEAKASIRTERLAALNELRTQVAMLSLQIAERLMKEKLSSDTAQRELAQRFLADLKLN